MSMPLVTVPKAAYCPSRLGVSFCMIKNCELAELFAEERAIDIVPLIWLILFWTPFDLNSPLIFSEEPPVPSPLGSPP